MILLFFLRSDGFNQTNMFLTKGSILLELFLGLIGLAGSLYLGF